MSHAQKKQKPEYELKIFDAKLTIKQDEGGEFVLFEGYASTFNDVDRHDDIVMPGAFRASLSKRTPKLLSQHDMRKPIGKIDEVFEDSKGLFIKGRMPKENSLVKDLEPLLRMGAIDSFSIGFNITDVEFRDDGVRLLKEIDLWEVSFVTIPANPRATLTSVKSVDQVKEDVKTKRDFERLLRESGAFSKDACVYLASCLKLPGDESGEEKDGQQLVEAKEVSALTENLNKLIGDLS